MAAIYDTKTVKEIFKTAGFILTDEYVSYNKKMKCICENGHEQEKPLASIKSGEGCYKCYCERPSPKRLTTQEFIEKAIAVHGDRYDYSRVMYTVSSEKVVIVCPEHGEFEQTPNKHLMGRACPKCALISKGYKKRKSLEAFKEELKALYGDKYSYDCTIYTRGNDPTFIRCSVHGIVSTTPKILLRGGGCKHCQMSKGEHKIYTWLTNEDIEFEQEYTFADCYNIRMLPFDFYLPDINILIEYDGELHYEPHRFGTEDQALIKLEQTKSNDSIKTKYALDNGIKLIRIPYWDYDNIEEILEEVIYG